MRDNSSFIGKQIGNYRLVAELKSGSYGSVFQGKHIIFAERPVVAIKLLHAAYFGSQEERESFIQEAQLLEKLKHPHILPILDAGIQDSIPYLVIEYASGGSLRDRLNQHPGQPLPIEEALTILSHIGQALYYAHQQKIVHRDLKPDNIVFNAQGEALLADFGIAAVLATARTRQIGQGGTPAYMAPEQFEGMVSMKSDQYSLGCIAYELLTGRKPFIVSHPSIEAMWYQHTKIEPVAPTQLNRHIPAYIEQAVLKAMAKQRAERHNDVSAFITALQKSSWQWFDEGNTLYDLNRYEEALAAYEQALRLDPNLAKAYYNKGNTLRDLKRYEEALGAYEQALRLNPNDAEAYYNKGNILRDLKRHEEALTVYEQALRLNPNHVNAYHNKGLTLRDLKRYEEALVACSQALRLNPNNASIYSNKSVILRDLKRYEEALAACSQALRLNPNHANAYHNKGATLYDLKRYKEALIAYEQALRLNPNHANAYYGKGLTLERLGRPTEAQQSYIIARELGYSG